MSGALNTTGIVVLFGVRPVPPVNTSTPTTIPSDSSSVKFVPDT
jgi:hypothetical protein